MSHQQVSEPSDERLLALMDAQFPTHASVARQRAAASEEPSSPSIETAPAIPTVDWSDITATRRDTADPANPGLLGLSTSQHKWIALPAGVEVPEHLREGNTAGSQTEAAQRIVAQMRAYAGAPQPAMTDAALAEEMARVFG